MKPRKVYTGACSICGTVDVIRRGWCSKHYQQWYRFRNPEITARVGTVKGTRPFSLNLWQQWLVSFNENPVNPLAEGIEQMRIALARREPHA